MPLSALDLLAGIDALAGLTDVAGGLHALRIDDRRSGYGNAAPLALPDLLAQQVWQTLSAKERAPAVGNALYSPGSAITRKCSGSSSAREGPSQGPRSSVRIGQTEASATAAT